MKSKAAIARCITASVATLCTLTTSDTIAGTLQISWTPPTQNTDGTPIPAMGPESLAGHVIYYGPCVNGALPSAPKSVAVGVVAAHSLNVDPGAYCFAVTAKNVAGMESDRSNVGTKVVAPATPKAPVVVETTAYRIQQTSNKLAVVSVGTVPLATACKADAIEVGGKRYNMIDKATVSYPTATRYAVTVARCG